MVILIYKGLMRISEDICSIKTIYKNDSPYYQILSSLLDAFKKLEFNYDKMVFKNNIAK